MTIDARRSDEELDIPLPSEHPAVIGMFGERAEADAAVEKLLAAGFAHEQLSLVARGGEGRPDGTFEPGGMIVTVRGERGPEAERLLRELGARDVRVGQVEATGAVVEQEAETEPAAET